MRPPGAKLPNGMTYKQAAGAKQANLQRITSLTSQLPGITDAATKAAAVNEINSRSMQNAEIDRLLPAGRGPCAVRLLLSGAPITASAEGLQGPVRSELFLLGEVGTHGTGHNQHTRR